MVIQRFVIDAAAQQAHLILAADIGFPSGIRWATASVDCKAKKVAVRGVTMAEDVPLNELKGDPVAVPGMTKGGMLSMSTSALMVKTVIGNFRLYCDGPILKSDFSAAVDNNGLRDLTTDLPAIRLRSYLMTGTSILDVPVLSKQRLTLEFDGTPVTRATHIDHVAVGDYATQPGQAFLYHDRAKNMLVPLRYDGINRSTTPFRNVPLPKDRLLHFYYAPDYRLATGWTRVVIDLQRGLTWNEPASKPAGATFTQ